MLHAGLYERLLYRVVIHVWINFRNQTVTTEIPELARASQAYEEIGKF